VAQRRREIGIRLALGERPGAVVTRIVREALVLAGGGLVVGVAIAGFSGSFLRGALVGVTLFDPLVIAATIAIVGSTALLAAAVPGWHASHVDPLRAVRSE
jgi:ABC-type antimicrobial peptide transport system permease subunit